MKIFSCRSQKIEVLNSFAEKIVILFPLGYLLFHEMVKRAERKLIRRVIPNSINTFERPCKLGIC